MKVGDLVRVIITHDVRDSYSPYWGRKEPLYGIVLKIDTFASKMEVEPTVLLYHSSGETHAWFASSLKIVNKF